MTYPDQLPRGRSSQVDRNPCTLNLTWSSLFSAGSGMAGKYNIIYVARELERETILAPFRSFSTLSHMHRSSKSMGIISHELNVSVVEWSPVCRPRPPGHRSHRSPPFGPEIYYEVVSVMDLWVLTE